MGSNLFSFCGTLISSLFCPAPPGMHSRIRQPLALFGFPDSLNSSNDLIRVEHNEGGETRRRGDFQVSADAVLSQSHGGYLCRFSNVVVFPYLQPEQAHLQSLSLVRSCVQKAVALLSDTCSATSRSMRRINILLTLLGAAGGQTGARFQEVLLARMVEALTTKEEMMASPRDWVSAQAKKRQALQEGGTLRYSRTRRRCFFGASSLYICNGCIGNPDRAPFA